MADLILVYAIFLFNQHIVDKTKLCVKKRMIAMAAMLIWELFWSSVSTFSFCIKSWFTNVHLKKLPLKVRRYYFTQVSCFVLCFSTTLSLKLANVYLISICVSNTVAVLVFLYMSIYNFILSGLSTSDDVGLISQQNMPRILQILLF